MPFVAPIFKITANAQSAIFQMVFSEKDSLSLALAASFILFVCVFRSMLTNEIFTETNERKEIVATT